jgi:MFS transporter, MHS family, proline/betaine transporter
MATSSLDLRRRWRVVAAASVGNALEWFDFVVYGFFAVTMARLFFPAGDETISILLALLTFGVPFFMRPLGAIVLGSFADRRGRKAAFTVTIVVMMIGTAIIAVTPTYASAGILAPAMVVLARILQGFSAGGEFGTATALLAEQNPQHRGFYGSWQFASQGLTTILATTFGVVMGSTLTAEQVDTWGWRIPFVFGLLIGPVAYYMRRHVDETTEFTALQQSGSPLRQAFADSKVRLLIAFGAVVLCTVSTYTVLFMPTFATRQLGLPVSGSFFAGLVTGAIQLTLIPVVGALTDRWGRLPTGIASAALILLLVYPLFAWLAAEPTLWTLLSVQIIIGVLTACYLGGLPALMAELFPTRMRTTGLAISYSFGVAIFGGFAPFINEWLIAVTHNKLAPSFYLMLAAAISLTALGAARRVGMR